MRWYVEDPPHARMSFLIWSKYNTLLSLQNLYITYTPNSILQHILNSKEALRWYWWWHHKMLRKLAKILEDSQFIQQRVLLQNTNQREGSILEVLLEAPCKMMVNLDWQLWFLLEITATSLRGDILVWSTWTSDHAWTCAIAGSHVSGLWGEEGKVQWDEGSMPRGWMMHLLTQ